MITIQQVKDDIASGKCKRIYYSTATLWWTHSDEDVSEATDKGYIAQQRKSDTMLNSPDVPEEEKKKLRSLQQMISKSLHKIPTDPTGAALFQMDDVVEWIAAAERKPEHFGKYGLTAFIHCHHQNSQETIFINWAQVNEFIDQENEK